MLALIESLRDLPREHGVHRAHDDENDWVEEGDHVARVHVRVAHQHVVFSRRVVEHRPRRGHDHPHHYY